MAYGSSSMAPMKQRSVAKSSASKTAGKMTDKQKADLKKHMDNHRDLKDLSPSQLKSHRAKMAARLRNGMSMAKAHKDIMKSKK